MIKKIIEMLSGKSSSSTKIAKTKEEEDQMKKVLFITANPKSQNMSFSLEAGHSFIEAYKAKNPEHKVEELDLYKLEIPFIDEDVFSGWGKLSSGQNFSTLTEVEQRKVGAINSYTDQFIDADKYVFVTPMWNLSMPPKVKLYIDTLMIAGRTFAYTEEGPIGLLKDKKAIHVHASGGVYSEGPAKGFEFGNSYLQAVMAFMGVTDFESVLLEGTNMPHIDNEAIKSTAVSQLSLLAQVF